jgi:hypothetical protein
MAQTQDQPAEAKPSLLARVFGSHIARTIGIVGVAFSLFQGFQPFLQFSRFMAYLVDHWRNFTRGLWIWIASLVKLDLTEWALDLLTLILFLIVFTVRGTLSKTEKEYAKDQSITYRLCIWLENRGESSVIIFLAVYVGCMLVFSLATFLSLYPHIGFGWALMAAIIVGITYRIIAVNVPNPWNASFGYATALDAERVTIILICLLVVNYLAPYSHAIEAWFREASK